MENTVINNTVAANNAAESVYGQIEQLVIERETWECTVYKTSNDMLYALLGKCYAYYETLCGKDAKAARAQLENYINMKGLRFTEATHTMTKIVKCVFGADRRRVSAYSIVLREALKRELNANDIPAFIAENGGVEEVRLSKSPTAVTPKQKAEAAINAVAQHSLAATSSGVSFPNDSAKGDQKCVAIVTQKADGTVEIHAIVHSKAALNAALNGYYGANLSKAAVAATQKAAANDDVVIAAAAA